MNRQITLVILLLSCLVSGLARAQANVQIEADSTDTPLVITGRIGEANDFIGNLRLTARGGDVSAFTFLSSDLKRENIDGVVGRQNVTLAGDPTLKADIPKNFQVIVNGLEEPGVYKGWIEILQQGRPRAEALAIDLTVKAKTQPALVLLPGTDQLQLRLVNCGGWLDCPLARRLLPTGAFLDSRELKFENTGKGDATMSDIEVVLLGEKTGYQLTDSQLEVPQGQQTFPAHQIRTLLMTLHRAAIPPDRYTGSVYLKLEDRDEQLQVPVDLSVRSGPFWPLLVLLLGIVLGRLFKYMQERGQPLSEALAAVNDMEVLIQDADPDDRKALATMVKKVRQLVYQEKLEKIKEQLEAIGERLEAFQNLRLMETSLTGKEQHREAKEAQKNIELARQHLTREEDANAKKFIDKAKENLESLGNATMGPEGKPDPTITDASRQAEEASAATERAAKSPHLRPLQPEWRRKLRSTLVILSGLSDEIRAEATLWLVRPLLYVALLLGLLVVGVSTLYVDKGATFGASPLADYLGLLIWGLSADVASRTLSNLKGGGAG